MASRMPLLVLLCVAQFVDVLDGTAVLVALPVVGQDLGLSGGALQWVVTAYVLVFATLHLQDVLRLGPTAAGVVLAPFSVAAVAGSIAAPRLPGPPPAVIAGGIALVAAGAGTAAAGLTATSGSLILVVWGALSGLGIGAASVAATTLGASAVGEADRATAAGLLNTAAQVGTALGIAGLVLVAGAANAATGHRIGFAASAAGAVLGAVLLVLLLGGSTRNPMRQPPAALSSSSRRAPGPPS